MSNFLQNLSKIVIGILTAIGLSHGTPAVQPVQNQPLGAPLASASALYSGYLASGIGTADTSMTLSTGVLKDGTSLTGWQCFTVDANTPSTEYICGNASGTAVSNLMRGVLVSNPNASSSALAYQHNRFATVDITDYPDLQILVRQLSGLDAINNQLFYSGVSTSIAPSSTSALPNWGQVTNFVTSVASSGAPDATQISKGLVQIATNAQIASGTATSTDGAQTLWNVVSAGQYGKSYGATPTVTSFGYGSATGTTAVTTNYGYTGSVQTVSIAAQGTQVNGHAVSSTQSIVLTVYGAQGNSDASGFYTGGLGGLASGTISTPSTSTYYLFVGNSGAGGAGGAGGTGTHNAFAGGAGGASSWFSVDNSYDGSVLLVAGGGGGGGGLAGSGGTTNGSNGGAGGADSGTGGTAGSGGGGGVANGTNGTAGTNNAGGGGGGGGATIGGGANSGQGGNGGGYVFGSGVTSTSTSNGVNSGTGSIKVVITYVYSDPTESVTSTIVGTNLGGTVTVNASTTHLSPTTSTINFASWTTNPSGVSCIALPWSNITPWVIRENTTSVEFGFSSAMVANSYNYNCTTY